MRTALSAAAVAAAIVALSADVTPAIAQTATGLQNSQIDIAYIEPANSDYRPIYERLQKRQVLEELREFLAPLKLPRKVLVKLDQCGQLVRPYEPGGPVTICYEYIAEIEKLAPQERTPRGVSRGDAIVGAFVQIVLHEMSHAVFDLLKVPVWGRENDAADKLAGFLMLQFGKDIARRTLNGAAWFFEASDRTWTGSDFSDTRGTEAQRFYNYLCMAYGGDKDTFADFIAPSDADTKAGGKGPRAAPREDLLPQRRVPWCAKEYRELHYAFNQLIMPHVDVELLKLVLARQWLRSDDGQ